MSDGRSEEIRSEIGRSTADSITVRGHDLARDLMGVATFGDVAFLLVSGRMPNDNEARLFNAVLVSLADHGLTPSALAARLTHTGAPEALQASVAAGLLGAGSVFLGPVADTAEFLSSIVGDAGPDPDDQAIRKAAATAVEHIVRDRRRVPGLGHPIHRATDPRTVRLYEIAREEGLAGPHLRSLEHVAEAYRETTGNALPINGAGAAGAALADLGFPPGLTRGFALLSRVAGLVAHLGEESERPLGMALWREVEGRVSRSE